MYGCISAGYPQGDKEDIDGHVKIGTDLMKKQPNRPSS